MPEYDLEVKLGQEPFPTCNFQDTTHFPREEFISAVMSQARFLAYIFDPGSSLLLFLRMGVTFLFLQSVEIFLDCHDFLKMIEKLNLPVNVNEISWFL